MFLIKYFHSESQLRSFTCKNLKYSYTIFRQLLSSSTEISEIYDSHISLSTTASVDCTQLILNPTIWPKWVLITQSANFYQRSRKRNIAQIYVQLQHYYNIQPRRRNRRLAGENWDWSVIFFIRKKKRIRKRKKTVRRRGRDCEFSPSKNFLIQIRIYSQRKCRSPRGNIKNGKNSIFPILFSIPRTRIYYPYYTRPKLIVLYNIIFHVYGSCSRALIANTEQT